jgi:hypothetical protein
MRGAGRVAPADQVARLGGAVAVGAVFASGVIYIWSPDVGNAVVGFDLLGVPIFTGVAIAR